MTSQPPELNRYLMFLGACLLVSFVAQSVGLVVGAAMNVQVNIMNHSLFLCHHVNKLISHVWSMIITLNTSQMDIFIISLTSLQRNCD